MPAEGHRLELLDPTDFDGRLHPTVRVTFDDDHVVHHYYDPDTLLLVRTRDHHALHPDLDPTIKWTETRMSDYRDVAGYHRYFREETVDLKTGQIVQKAIVRDVGCNVAVAPGLFAMPG